MTKYPIYLDLSGRLAVVIGAGPVARRKAQALLDAGARLVLIADQIDDALITLCHRANAELIRSKYSKSYLAEALLVIAATNNPQLNKQIYKDCQKLEIICNVVDEPELCDFFVPAVVKRGDLQIAIGTEGHSPAFAGHIRKKLEHIFTEKHGEFLAELHAFRKRIIDDLPDSAGRKALLGKLVEDRSFSYFVENGMEQWRSYAEQLITAEADAS